MENSGWRGMESSVQLDNSKRDRKLLSNYQITR